MPERFPCRVYNCRNTRRERDVVCREHWFQLPESERKKIWSLYRNAPGGPAHVGALTLAVKYLNELEAKKERAAQ